VRFRRHAPDMIEQINAQTLKALGDPGPDETDSRSLVPTPGDLAGENSTAFRAREGVAAATQSGGGHRPAIALLQHIHAGAWSLGLPRRALCGRPPALVRRGDTIGLRSER